MEHAYNSRIIKNPAETVPDTKPEEANPNEPSWNARLLAAGVGAIIAATVILFGAYLY